MTRKFLVRTFGCQMNEHDSQRIAADLASQGLESTDVLDEADIVVLNTCCIRENADNKLYGHLGHLKALREQRPDLQIAVGGCLAQKDRELILERAPHVDVVFGTHNVARAFALLRDAKEHAHSVIEILDQATEDDPFPGAMAVRPELAHAAWVTIQIGCDNSCAFCIVPSVRGKEQSRPFGEIVSEIEELSATGTSEVTLLGQNVNSYGRDLTLSWRTRTDEQGAERVVGERYLAEAHHGARPLFADLLRAVGAIEGIRRVRFTSPHPKDLRPETIAAMAETDAVCEQLHLPLQSGSDRVLQAMRRGYQAGRYLERLAAARRAIEDLAVSTDLIVGFPGESDEDFEDTLEVVAEAAYDSAFTFIFSPRPGTRAAELADQFVAEDVVAERFARLKAVVDRSTRQAHLARVGRVEEVVIDGPSKKDPAMLTGRTRQGKLAHFAPVPGSSVGTYGKVEITAAGAHHLIGRMIEVEDSPAPARPARRLIPVQVG